MLFVISIKTTYGKALPVKSPKPIVYNAVAMQCKTTMGSANSQLAPVRSLASYEMHKRKASQSQPARLDVA